MLLNLVRIRYLEEPVFLSISSILTQYVYKGGAGVGTSVDLGVDLNGGDADTVAAEANVNYESVLLSPTFQSKAENFQNACFLRFPLKRCLQLPSRGGR